MRCSPTYTLDSITPSMSGFILSTSRTGPITLPQGLYGDKLLAAKLLTHIAAGLFSARKASGFIWPISLDFQENWLGSASDVLKRFSQNTVYKKLAAALLCANGTFIEKNFPYF